MSLINNLQQFAEWLLDNDNRVKHIISLGIFIVFAIAYLKVCYLTKDFADLDTGWTIVLLGLAGITHAPDVVKMFKSDGTKDAGGTNSG